MTPVRLLICTLGFSDPPRSCQLLFLDCVALLKLNREFKEFLAEAGSSKVLFVSCPGTGASRAFVSFSSAASAVGTLPAASAANTSPAAFCDAWRGRAVSTSPAAFYDVWRSRAVSTSSAASGAAVP